MRIIEKEGVAVANPNNDQYRDFLKLVDYYHSKGRKVFAFFNREQWHWLNEYKLRSYQIQPRFFFPKGYLAEITEQKDNPRRRE